MHFGPSDALGAGRIGPAKGDLELYSEGALRIRLLVNGAWEVQPVTVDPNAPLDGAFTLFAKTNANGKAQLFVRFHTGAVQIIATEP